jgi:hypothetical protein
MKNFEVTFDDLEPMKWEKDIAKKLEKKKDSTKTKTKTKQK